MKVNEMFISVDGEVNRWGQGKMTAFIRAAGCSLNCEYCDTKYAQNINSGKDLTASEILSCIPFGLDKVTITGGEPMEQSGALFELCQLLIIKGYKISIETNGTIPIPEFWTKRKEVSFVVDYKLDNEFRVDVMKLDEHDFIKFVIGSVEDYEQARAVVQIINTKANIVFSPMFGKVNPADLLQSMIDDELYRVGLNYQLHKVIDIDERKKNKLF